MTAVVVDASALVEYLLGSDRGAATATIVEDPATDLHTTALCDIEVASALRGLICGGSVTIVRALESIEDYGDLPLTRHAPVPLLVRVLELRDNFSAYDAVYVALAEALGAGLLTCDGALSRAVRKYAPAVRLVPVP